MHCRKPNYNFPDYIVFDLDPPEGYVFKEVIDIAINLKSHIETFGDNTFVKTTGGKGVHIVVPLVPSLDFNTVFDAAQLLANPFVEKYPKETTLHIKKEARKGEC